MTYPCIDIVVKIGLHLALRIAKNQMQIIPEHQSGNVLYKISHDLRIELTCTTKDLYKYSDVWFYFSHAERRKSSG